MGKEQGMDNWNALQESLPPFKQAMSVSLPSRIMPILEEEYFLRL